MSQGLLIFLGAIAGAHALPWPRTFSGGVYLSTEELLLPRRILQDLNGGNLQDMGVWTDAQKDADFLFLSTSDFLPRGSIRWSDVKGEQRVNKCPGLRHIGDRGWFGKRVRAVVDDKVPLDMSCLPKVYLLPQNLTTMKKDALFFLKSPDLHGGRVEFARNSDGAIEAFLKRMAETFGNHTKWIAQDYVKPFLFDSRKFHIRLYVLVTSIEPLKVWMLPKWSYMSLAYDNYSVPAAGVDGSGVDGLLKELTNPHIIEKERPKEIREDPERYWKPLETLRELGDDIFAKLIGEMKEAVTTTLLVVAPLLKQYSKNIPHQRSCFELLGYDVLIDSEGKSKILEINRSPSMDVHFGETKIANFESMLGDVFCIGGLGCERASLDPGAIRANEGDTELDALQWRHSRQRANEADLDDEAFDAVQCLEREQRRGARTEAVQIWPDEQAMAKFSPVMQHPAYEIFRESTERKSPQEHSEL